MNMFIKAPKINFCGYYRLKEKYWHTGERKGDQYFVNKYNQNPLKIYKFYRFVRFFPDGSVIHMMLIKKPTIQQILNLL